MDKYVEFPATSLPKILGLAVTVIAILVVAKRVPFVKTLV